MGEPQPAALPTAASRLPPPWPTAPPGSSPPAPSWSPAPPVPASPPWRPCPWPSPPRLIIIGRCFPPPRGEGLSDGLAHLLGDLVGEVHRLLLDTLAQVVAHEAAHLHVLPELGHRRLQRLADRL